MTLSEDEGYVIIVFGGERAVYDADPRFRVHTVAPSSRYSCELTSTLQHVLPTTGDAPGVPVSTSPGSCLLNVTGVRLLHNPKDFSGHSAVLSDETLWQSCEARFKRICRERAILPSHSFSEASCLALSC